MPWVKGLNVYNIFRMVEEAERAGVLHPGDTIIGAGAGHCFPSKGL